MSSWINGLVSTITVTWNSADSIRATLQALKAQTYPQIEVIIVDNNSADATLSIVEEVMPEAIIVRQASNTGFCGGQNAGMAVAKGEFILPLNPDVEMTPNFIAEMQQAMQHHASAGMVSGKLRLLERDATGTPLLDGAGLALNRARRQYLRGHGQPDRGQFDRGEYVFGVCGAAPLYRRSMLEAIKIDDEYFDNAFFAHKEDLDLAWRAQILGWRSWYEPRAVAYHNRNFRPSRRAVMTQEVKLHAVKNRYLAIIKNDLLSNVLRDLVWIVGYDLQIVAYILLRERSSLPAFKQVWSLLPNTWRKRRAIMQRKQVTDRYMRGLVQ